MTSKIVIDGRALATPARFTQRGSELWGLFLAEDEGTQYDQWLYWGEATPVNLTAIEAAGIPIDLD